MLIDDHATFLALLGVNSVTRQFNPFPIRLPVGEVRGQGGAHVPKAQELKRRSRGPRPCNKEDAMTDKQTDRQTDRQTNFPRIIVKCSLKYRPIGITSLTFWGHVTSSWYSACKWHELS